MDDTVYILYKKNSTDEWLKTSDKKELIGTIFMDAITFWEKETIGIKQLNLKIAKTKCNDGSILEVYNIVYDASPESYFDIAYNVKVIKGGKIK